MEISSSFIITLLLAAAWPAGGKKRDAVPIATFANQANRSSNYLVGNVERRIFLAEHNRWRSRVRPPAGDMLRMVWSAELELLSFRWALRCRYEHHPPQLVINSPQFDVHSLGQNLHVSRDDYNISNVIATWHTEGLFYNYLQHTTDNVGQGCPVDHDCTRYVQMVWAKSYALGCSLVQCERLRSEQNTHFDNVFFTVCHYGPTGATGGGVPYSPAVHAHSCTSCPHNFTRCEQNLCSSVYPCTSVKDRCTADINNHCLCQDSFYRSYLGVGPARQTEPVSDADPTSGYRSQQPEPVSDTTSSDSYRGNSQQPQLDDRRESLSAPADSSVDDSATSHTNTSLDQPVNPRQSPDQADTGTFGDTNVRVDDKNSDNTDEEGGLGAWSIALMVLVPLLVLLALLVFVLAVVLLIPSRRRARRHRRDVQLHIRDDLFRHPPPPPDN